MIFLFLGSTEQDLRYLSADVSGSSATRRLAKNLKTFAALPYSQLAK
jgi:hypothetical protein